MWEKPFINVKLCSQAFVKAVYTECKYVNARLIDIDTSAVNSVMFRKQLVNDLLERNNFSFIAYRGENRYIEAYASFDEIGNTLTTISSCRARDIYPRGRSW